MAGIDPELPARWLDIQRRLWAPWLEATGKPNGGRAAGTVDLSGLPAFFEAQARQWLEFQRECARALMQSGGGDPAHIAALLDAQARAAEGLLHFQRQCLDGWLHAAGSFDWMQWLGSLQRLPQAMQTGEATPAPSLAPLYPARRD